MTEGRYYWLKLKRDFFKRHDIRIVEDMPNGKEYILFYLKLLCESVDHEGNLRFSDEIPYNDEMLASVTNTNISVVRGAVELFSRLGMMDLMDDGTLFMNGVERMIGSAAGNDNAKRQARFRERQKEQLLLDCYDGVTKSNESKSKSKSKNKKENIKEKFTPPTLEEVTAYCRERGNNVDPQKFIDFYESKGWMIGKNKMKDFKACVRTWERNRNETPKQVVKVPDYITAQERGDYEMSERVAPTEDIINEIIKMQEEI